MMMVPPDTHKRLNAGLAALLFSFLVLAACRLGSATPTATTAPAVAATNGGEAVVEDPTDVPPTVDNSILFEDDFSDDDSGWPVVQLGVALASYQNPELYRLDVSAAETILLAARPGAFSDFSLETIVTGSSGASGQFRYGVVFRQITPDNYYAAFINPVSQTYVIAKRLLGEWSTLAEGQNAAIPTTGDPVTLRIDALGPNLTYSINGTGLVTLVDTSFAAGDIGYVAETLDAAAMRLDADYVVIRRFNADTVPNAPTAAPIIPTATETPGITDTPTAPPPTTRPVGGTPVAPPPTVNVAATLPAVATAVMATASALGTQAAAALTQACATLPCP